MRWFLGLFLCRLVPVRRWLQTFILWLSGLLSVGLRQWNHLIELIPVLWKFDVSTFVKIHQFDRFLRWISLVEAAIWVLSTFVVESCQPFVAEAASRFPEETNPLQTKFCVICRRSFSEFAVARTFTDLSSVGSVEIHQIFFRGESLVLQSWGRVTVEVHPDVFWSGFLHWTQSMLTGFI